MDPRYIVNVVPTKIASNPPDIMSMAMGMSTEFSWIISRRAEHRVCQVCMERLWVSLPHGTKVLDELWGFGSVERGLGFDEMGLEWCGLDWICRCDGDDVCLDLYRGERGRG